MKIKSLNHIQEGTIMLADMIFGSLFLSLVFVLPMAFAMGWWGMIWGVVLTIALVQVAGALRRHEHHGHHGETIETFVLKEVLVYLPLLVFSSLTFIPPCVVLSLDASFLQGVLVLAYTSITPATLYNAAAWYGVAGGIFGGVIFAKLVFDFLFHIEESDMLRNFCSIPFVQKKKERGHEHRLEGAGAENGRIRAWNKAAAARNVVNRDATPVGAVFVPEQLRTVLDPVLPPPDWTIGMAGVKLAITLTQAGITLGVFLALIG